MIAKNMDIPSGGWKFKDKTILTPYAYSCYWDWIENLMFLFPQIKQTIIDNARMKDEDWVILFTNIFNRKLVKLYK